MEEHSRFPSWSENALREQTRRKDTSFGVLLKSGMGVSVLIQRPGPAWADFPAGITEGEPGFPRGEEQGRCGAEKEMEL